MTRLAAAALIIVVVLAGCALISPQLDVAVENNSDQEAVLEIVDGITGTVPPPATISRAAVPAQQTTTVSMTRAAEWSLGATGSMARMGQTELGLSYTGPDPHTHRRLRARTRRL